MRRTQVSMRIWALAVLVALLAGVPAWGRQTPAAAPQGDLDPGALARFVPAQPLYFYIEFQGLDSHPDAWKQTAASKILSETKTGEMLSEILTQLAEQGLANIPGRKLTGADTSALLQHAMKKGFVLGGFGVEGNSGGFVLVIRDALDQEAGPVIGRFLATTGLAGPNTKAVTRPDGRRLVQVAPSNPELGWWVEDKKDLVFTSHASLVVRAIKGETPNASTNADRQAMTKAEGGFQPVGLMFLDLSGVPMPPEAARLGLDGLKKVQYRWGFEDKALRSEWRILAPSPRSGLLALANQPSFTLKDVPPLPEGVENFMILSVDPPGLFEQVIALSKLMPATPAAPAGAGASVEEAVAAFEKSFKEKTRKDFREDVLAQIGPKVVFYFAPEKKSSTGSALSALNPLNGLQMPKAVTMIEVKDAKKFTATMTELVKVLNKSMAPPTPPPSGSGSGSGNQPRPGQGGTTKPAQPPGFRLSTSNPPTWILSMPQLALLNLRPTVAVGRKHLIVATSPDLVKAAITSEQKEGAWEPSGETAEAVGSVPANMIFLSVSDPRGSMPETLAGLPDILKNALAAVAQGAAASGPGMSPPPAPAGAGGAPRLPSPGGVDGGPPGASSGGVDGAGDPGGGAVVGIRTKGGGVGLRPEFQRQGGAPGQPGAPPQAPGLPPGAPPGMAGATMGNPLSGLLNIKLDVPPEKRPDPKEIEKLLFPGSTAVSVDDQGLTITTREAFFNVGTSIGGAGALTAMMLPAVQAARDAARRAAERNGTLPPGQPGALGPQGGPAPGIAPPPGGNPAPGAAGRRRDR